MKWLDMLGNDGMDQDCLERCATPVDCLLGGCLHTAKGKAMTDCPRMFTKEQMLDGLKKGRKLRVDRRDAPELPELLAMEKEGLLVSRLVELDEQSSFLEFMLAPQPSLDNLKVKFTDKDFVK